MAHLEIAADDELSFRDRLITALRYRREADLVDLQRDALNRRVPIYVSEIAECRRALDREIKQLKAHLAVRRWLRRELQTSVQRQPRRL